MARYALRFKKGDGPTSEIIPLLRSLTDTATSTVRRNYFEKPASIGLIWLPSDLDPTLVSLLADGIRGRLVNGGVSLHEITTGSKFEVQGNPPIQEPLEDRSGEYHVYSIEGNFPVFVAALDVYFLPGEHVYQWSTYGKASPIGNSGGEYSLSYAHPFENDSYGIVKAGKKTDYLSECYSG
jgi:hypothetical protein